MKIKDIMTTNLISVLPDQTISNAAKLMIENNISVLPVTSSDQKLIGIITESDFVGKKVSIPHALASIKQLFSENFYTRNVEEIYHASKNRSVKEVMTTKVKTIQADYSLNELVNMMITKSVKRVPVLEGDKLVGIVTRRDIVKAFNKI